MSEVLEGPQLPRVGTWKCWLPESQNYLTVSAPLNMSKADMEDTTEFLELIKTRYQERVGNPMTAPDAVTPAQQCAEREREFCIHCGKSIHRVPAGSWAHDEGDEPACLHGHELATPPPTQHDRAREIASFGDELHTSSMESSDVGAHLTADDICLCDVKTLDGFHDDKCPVLVPPAATPEAQIPEKWQRLYREVCFLNPRFPGAENPVQFVIEELAAAESQLAALRVERDRAREALNETTECLGDLLGWLMVHYRDAADAAQIHCAVRQLHQSKEMVRSLAKATGG